MWRQVLYFLSIMTGLSGAMLVRDAEPACSQTEVPIIVIIRPTTTTIMGFPVEYMGSCR
jgi:hypothetical protein